MRTRELALRGCGSVARSRAPYGWSSLTTDFDRMIDELFGRTALIPLTRVGASEQYSPRLDVSETDKVVTVTAELPGLEEKDVSIELDEDYLVIKGEKKTEGDKEDEHLRRSERSYGSFQRVVALPAKVDGSKSKAKFKNGLLSVTLPKVPEENTTQKIEIG